MNTGQLRAWQTGGVLAAAGLLVVYLLPIDSLARGLASLVVEAVAVAVLILGSSRMPKGIRMAWWSITGFAAMSFIADAVYTTQLQLLGPDNVPFPGMADAFYLGAYVFGLTGLLALGKSMSPVKQRATWIDTAILVLAAASLGGALIIGPALMEGQSSGWATAVAVAYPILDLILGVALLRIISSQKEANPSLIMLAVAMFMYMIYDIAYNVSILNGGWEDSSMAETWWVGTFVLLAGAIGAPGARRIKAAGPDEEEPITLLHAAFLAVAAILPSAVVMYQLMLGHYLLATWLAPASLAVAVLVLLRLYEVLHIVRSQAREMESQARNDKLTGLANRRSWDYALPRMAKEAQSSGAVLHVALLDLDHFKNYNDQNGHQAGDELLEQAAASWSNALPEGAFLSRYGGEEFGILLSGIGRGDADALLETLRAATPSPQTASLGVTALNPGEDPDKAVHRADVALYAAKEAGRNRLVRL